MDIKVENTPYTKNPKTGCINNKDITGYTARRRVISKGKKLNNRITHLEHDLQSMNTKLDKLLEVLIK